MPLRPPFSKEQIQEAVANSKSYAATARKLGYSARGSNMPVKRWIEHYGISVDHFGGPGSHFGRSPNFLHTDEELQAAVAASKTYADVCRYLGRTTAGGTSTHFAKRIRAAGINTDHFYTRSEASRASYRGQRTWNTPDRIFVLLPEGSNRPKAEVLRRLLLEAGVEHACKLCGQGPTWQDQPIVLHVDHVDGNYLNNLFVNLRFLCPNCHTQQPTSRGGPRRY